MRDTRTALPLHFSAERKAVDQPNPERAWVYDPAASPDTLDALLAAKGKYAALVAHQLQKQREQLEGTG